MKKQILSNIVSHYALNFIGMALGFFVIPFLIGRIGSEAFGLVVLAESMTAFFDIVTVSLQIATSRHATVAASAGDNEQLTECLATGHAAMSVCALAALAIGGGLALFFPSIFWVPAGLEDQSRALFLFVVISFALSVRNTVYWSALYAKQRFDLIHTSTSVGLVFRAAAIFAVYFFLPKTHASILPYAAIGLGTTLAQNGLVRFWHGKLLPGIRYPFRRFNRAQFRAIVSFGGHASLSRLSQVLYGDTSTLLINLWWGPAANAVFAISGKLPDLARRVFIDPTWSLTPTFTDLAARGDKTRMERLFFSYSKGLAIVGFPACFMLALQSRPLLSLWMGPGFEQAIPLMSLNTAWLFFGIPFSLLGCLLNAYARVRVPSFISLISAILNIGLCFLLGRAMNMGLFGMALAGAIASCVLPNLFTPIYACRIAGLSTSRYWMEVFLKPIFLSALVCGLGMLALERFAMHDLYRIAGGFALAALSCGVSIILLLNPEEKALALDILRMVSRRK